MQRSGRSKMFFLKNKPGFTPGGRLAVRNLVTFLQHCYSFVWCRNVRFCGL